MTHPKVNGSLMARELVRAVNANRAAQVNLRRLLNEQPGPQTQAVLLARMAASLGENLDALTVAQQVVVKSKRNDGNYTRTDREKGKDASR